MDEIDQAQAINEERLADALADHFRRVSSGTAPGSYHCHECGDPIPEARRKAAPGCVRCIDCQTLYEIHVHGRV